MKILISIKNFEKWKFFLKENANSTDMRNINEIPFIGSYRMKKCLICTSDILMSKNFQIGSVVISNSPESFCNSFLFSVSIFFFTFSKLIGFLFWGMVEEPTCFFSNCSPISAISLLCKLRISSAKFAKTPKASITELIYETKNSASTTWVEIGEGLRSNSDKTCSSNFSGFLKNSE